MHADLVVKSILFNQDCSKILLLQRSGADPIGANTWENAGGNLEQGENPEDAVRREIQEETGIAEIAVKRVAYVTLIDGDAPYLIIAYICESPTTTVRLSHEHQAFQWADQEACKAMLPEPIIDDFIKNGIFDLFHGGMD